MNTPIQLNNLCAYPYINLHLIHLANRFKKRNKRAEQIQSRLLDWLIKLNGNSDFGQAHGLARVRNYKDLVQRVGITDYETYRPYVEQMADGNNRALLGSDAKPVMFALTSGTTGKPKQIPVTKLFLRNYRRGWFLLVSWLWRNHKELWYRQVFQLSSPLDDYFTTAGIPCGAISGMTAKMPHWLARSYYSVPQDATYIKDTSDRYYAAIRIAAEQDVGLIVTASPATLIGMAKSVQQRSEELLRDIHDGSLSEKCQIPAELRQNLCRKLKPNPKLAKKLEQKTGSEGLLPRDYWRVSIIACWLGGTMGLYIPQLRELYGKATLHDIGLLASEGRMSIPLIDESPQGVLDIDNNFYEFIPAEEIDNWSGPALLGHELQIGQKYFILLSTPNGFFRYNMSDVVEVVDYLGEAPVISFLNKGTHISSIVGEKLSAYNVVQAMAKASKIMGQENQCCDAVLCPQWSEPPFYRLNIDAKACAGLETSEGQKKLAEAFDQALIEVNIEYKSKRKTGRLGPAQLRTLEPGYLAQCDRKKMARSVTARSQFKHQYLLTELAADKDFPVLEKEKNS
ncbi:MAG: hypothetical protein GWP14_06320 [Actinobacteria bacterium]|nr:hypothetical protein [Actinomycetota bacterium]